MDWFGKTEESQVMPRMLGGRCMGEKVVFLRSVPRGREVPRSAFGTRYPNPGRVGKRFREGVDPGVGRGGDGGQAMEATPTEAKGMVRSCDTSCFRGRSADAVEFVVRVEWVVVVVVVVRVVVVAREWVVASRIEASAEAGAEATTASHGKTICSEVEGEEVYT